MQALLRTVTSRWVLTAFGLISAAVMVGVFGQLVNGFGGWLPRLLAILAMSFIWLAVNLAIERSRHRQDNRLRDGITGTSAGADASAGADDVSEQRKRMTLALNLLRRERGRRGYLYEQPWYALIGPPNSGKSTALANAGLRFSLAAELDGGEVRGVGGTRFCDWSFADEAVLIDTAGRYTTQDSNAAVDKAGWEGFLDLLRRTRPRQPLNGVIVAISATDIAQASEQEWRAHARSIRGRVKELYTRLAVRIPVYVLFTKLDLVQGFMDFFADLDKERRAQVWGVTFPLETGHTGPAGTFPAEFRSLTAQLSARLIDRLQAERSPERRAAIADFPAQFASLEAPIAAFVEETFAGTRIEPAALLRGVYFVSGTQEGSPIDRLTGALARGFGIDQRRAAALRPAEGRGYFLDRLLKKVVFGEAMLVALNPRAARRRLIWRSIAWSLAGTTIVAGLATLWFADRSLAERQQRFDAALASYRQSAEAAQLSPVPIGGTDLRNVSPVLDQARALQKETAAGEHGDLSLGLSQGDSLASEAEDIYGRALQYILLPRLVSSIEVRMRGHADDLDYLYRATRVYLILCGRGGADNPMVREWFQDDWAETYGGASLAPFRTDLLTHLDALLARHVIKPVAPDPDVLGHAQEALANISVADRAYALLRSSEAAQAARPFIPDEAIGELASAHFVRASGHTMHEPIPGVFTAAGLRTAVLPEMPRAIELAIGESWVLGQASKIDADDVKARQQLERKVMDRYAKDYQAAWDGLLGDLNIVPPANSNAAVTDLSLLTGPKGPIRLLLAAIVQQFDLTSAQAAGDGSAPTRPASRDPALKALEDHFRQLRDFVELGQIDRVLDSVDRLQRQISDQVAASASSSGPVVQPGVDPAGALMKVDAPQPVARWVQTLAQRGGAVRDDASRQQAAAAYGSALSLCQDVVQHFPFRPTAKDDVPFDSFGELFAPNGRFDSFFSQFVRPFVDTSQAEWKLRSSAGSQTPVTAEGVAQFQRALTIRDTFFRFGSRQPQFQFALHPRSLDAATSQVTLDLGGNLVVWKSSELGGARTLDWPGPPLMTPVSAAFDPAGDGEALRQVGPWALFRFLQGAKLDRLGDGGSYAVTLRQGSRQVQFDLSTVSAHSPFDAELLTRFKCPALRP
jgi:type VI secretion system protein ImpL